jgi:predicted ATP-dependent serine protease
MELNFESTKLTKVSDIDIPDRFYRRMQTGIELVDELLNDGFLPGSTMTLTAVPGGGKSTFCIQVIEGLAKNGYSVGYCSGEENIFQLAMTCKRVGSNNINIANITDVDDIAELTKECDFVVVDSFQSLTTKVKMNSTEKENYALTTLVKAAQENECVVCFIVHITKAGLIKGTTAVPHTVDANLNITIDSELDEMARRVWYSKNRFGPTNQVTLMMTSAGFDMTSKVVPQSDTKSISKRNRKDQIKRDIMLSTVSPECSQIVAKYNVSIVYAGTALRELVDEGKLIKRGRGKAAKWLVNK